MNPHVVIEYLYKWKKVGAPPWVATGNALADGGIEAIIAMELWAGDSVEHLKGKAQKYSRAVYTTATSEGLLLGGDDGLLMDVPLDQRLADSRDELNPAFHYLGKLGAAEQE